MPKITWEKRSFAGGELSPQICQSRTDFPIYSQGVSHCLNLIPLPNGALIDRPSTLSYPDCDLPPHSRRLIPFYLSSDIYVMLVFGDEELSIVKIVGGEPPKIAQGAIRTPYKWWEAEQLDYALHGSLMVLVHRKNPPHKLEFEGEDFSFSVMKFSPSPWLGDSVIRGARSDAQLSVRIPESGGGLIEVESSDDVFKRGDEGRYLRLGITPGSWRPKEYYPKNTFISRYGRVHQSTQAGISGEMWADNTRDAFIRDGGIIWKVVASYQGVSAGALGGDEKKGVSLGVQGAVAPYYVWGVIEGFIDAKNVRIKLSSDISIPMSTRVDTWNLSAWGQEEGYPYRVTFYQNRLVFYGTGDDASSFYLSEYNNFYSFYPNGEYGVVDYLKALSMAITDDAMREIRWIRPMSSGLLIGCDSSLWMFRIDMERGFNVVSTRVSGAGVYDTPPLSVGDYLFFVGGSGRKIKAVSSGEERGFEVIDITRYADHLFGHPITQMVYQEEPHSIAWAIGRQ